MNRRKMLGVGAATVAAATGLLTKQTSAAEPAEDCCPTCVECAESCLACADHCLDLLKDGKVSKDCVKTCLDCADICGTCARIGARKGPMAKIIAAACAEACEKCAAECGEHKDDKTMAACAARCLECAKKCRVKAAK